MNPTARCSACGQNYPARTFQEKQDPKRLCDRCYIDRTQPPMDLFTNRPAGAEVQPPSPASFPAASAAGLSNPKE